MAGRGTVLGRSRKPVQEALRARGRRSTPKRTVRGEPPGSHNSSTERAGRTPRPPSIPHPSGEHRRGDHHPWLFPSIHCLRPIAEKYSHEPCSAHLRWISRLRRHPAPSRRRAADSAHLPPEPMPAAGCVPGRIWPAMLFRGAPGFREGRARADGGVPAILGQPSPHVRTQAAGAVLTNGAGHRADGVPDAVPSHGRGPGHARSRKGPDRSRAAGLQAGICGVRILPPCGKS